MTTEPACPTAETAVMFATAPWETALSGLDSRTPLDPLLGKPLLQRAVEKLVRSGARRLLVVVDEHAGEIRDFLGDGQRWGCRISCHYPDPAATLGRYLEALGIGEHDYVWIANAWSIPEHDPPPAQHRHGLALRWADGTRRRWTGWGCFSGAWLRARRVPIDPAALSLHIAEDPELASLTVEQPLAAITPHAYLAIAAHLLDVRHTDIGDHPLALIHPTARLIPPYHIGKGARIDAEAVIGPHAVVEAGAHVASGAHIHHAVLMPDTHVGPQLDLHCAIARGSLLVSAGAGGRMAVRDPALLSPREFRHARTPVTSRLIATVLGIALKPLQVWLHRSLPPGRGRVKSVSIPHPVPENGEMEARALAVSLPRRPSKDTSYDWAAHFLDTFYPGLSAVRRGELRFIGPSLRSMQDVAALPPEWRELYHQCPCGLLNDAWLRDVPPQAQDELFACDVIAAAGKETPGRSLHYIKAYLRQVWQHRLPGNQNSTSSEVNAV